VVYTEFYDVVENRRSIRKYKDSPVEKEKLYRVLESLTLAPSWSCKHCWRLLVVDDVELKTKVAESINENNPARYGVFQASAVMLICADPVNAEEIDGREYYMADCGIAMEHLMLSASNEGLATCWTGLFDEDKLKQIFDIPELTRIVALSPLGYGDETPEPRKEKGIKDITYSNKWDSEMIFK
jgi:nitroreductase